MILLYSSHGDAAKVYKLCEKKMPEPSALADVGKAISEACSDPRSLSASVLDRREIKALVRRSDPRYFLFLRELSVHIRKAYDPLVSGLIGLGYTPSKNILVRLCDGTTPTEILAVGVLSALCGVKDLTLSLDRATMTPEIAAACRLCGIENIILCDEVSAAGIAAYGTYGISPFSRFVCVGSEILSAACGLTCGAIENIFYPEQRTRILALFGKEFCDTLLADIACLDNCIFPVIVTSCEEEVRSLEDSFKEKDGIILVTSGDEETCAVLGKCKNAQKRLYGASPTDVHGIRADKASPLMLSASAPDSVYPYKPTDFMVPPDRNGVIGVTEFASSIATFVEKSVVPDEEIEAIGVRF